jgi:nicotinamide-nucleotide amidase
MAIHLHHPHKVAILAIGTEITSGEITNSNAAKLAHRMTEFGFHCDMHITVPDQRDLMHWAIESALSGHGIIFITGGLGPTTDDFTREVIATAATTKLVWNESIWQMIVKRLESVGAPIAESNKQQAFFPEGATIYPNHHGTASAFSLRCGKSLVFALPGPPREIEGLWHDHLKAVISSMAPVERSQTPKRWRCLGLSESKLGEIVEAALDGSALLTGYRSHIPYIDVKVWVPDGRKADFESKWRPKLEDAIATWLVGRDHDDASDMLRTSAPLAVPIYILDRATQGYIAQRIYAEPLPSGCQMTVLTTDYLTPMPPVGNGCIVATVSANIETGAWQLVLTGSGPHKSLSDQSRFKGKIHADRLRAHIGEKTLLSLAKWFQE